MHNLQAPDILSVEEVQDNSGATNDGVVAADQTLTKLVTAISAAGGPTYQWRELDPVNDEDGGQPGGNIRQVFLFRTDRGGRDVYERGRRPRQRRVDAAPVQPRPHRPGERRVAGQPQAARR